MADGANPNPPPSTRKQAVPGWLNSPIWSTPPTTPRHRSPPRAPSPPRPPAPQPPGDPAPPAPPPPASNSDSDDDEGAAAASSRTHLVAEFNVALGRKVVDLAELQRLACQGVPDTPGVRPVVWKSTEDAIYHSHARDMALAKGPRGGRFYYRILVNDLV